MAEIEYDVRDVSTNGPSRGKKRRRTRVPEPGSFDERVSSRERDLIALIRDGIPPVEYLPASDGMLVRGKRHLIAAPQKTGKSLGVLVHAVDMVLAGAVVVILDRENGANEYARRLDAILRPRELSKAQEQALGKGLHYIEFPRLTAGDGPDFAELITKLKGDLVVFDSQRMFLTDLGLGEGDADEYAAFVSAVIEPAFNAGIATLLLDNTGHENKDRARGSSTKGDLNEVLFVLREGTPFSTERRGSIDLVLEPGQSRFGNEGTWTLSIGGGHFGSWTANRQPERKVALGRDRRARELITEHVEQHPGATQTRTLRAVKSHGVGEEPLRDTFKQMTRDGTLEPHPEINNGYRLPG